MNDNVNPVSEQNNTSAPAESPATLPVEAVQSGVQPVPTAAAGIPAPLSLTRVYKLDSIAERTFWIGHILFSALVIVGALLIIFGRGPRRRDALISTVSERKD